MELLLYMNERNNSFWGKTLPYCWKCGAEMKDDARFCPKCGASVSGRVRREKEREWWEWHRVYCIKCGTKNEDDAVPCMAIVIRANILSFFTGAETSSLPFSHSQIHKWKLCKKHKFFDGPTAKGIFVQTARKELKQSKTDQPLHCEANYRLRSRWERFPKRRRCLKVNVQSF